MLKKTIKFVDYNDVEREEDFYFNLNKAEVTEMELSMDGGMMQYIEKIVAEKDGPSMIKLWKDLILKSYGEKSPDGRLFVKTEELQVAFTQTEAYSILFMELAQSAELAANFVNGILPQFES